MDTANLKRFGQFARRSLIGQVSAKLGYVLAESSAARRESPEAVRKLEAEVHLHGRTQVVEKAAYVWFNRFCALRFMDVNRYNNICVVSPAEGQSQPEILAEAKNDNIDAQMVGEAARRKVKALIDGKMPSPDPQAEAYRLLVVAVCNHLSQTMPFLFQPISDYTELLMPDDLLSSASILAAMRETLTAEVCQDVEVIGWLYQFYISEKKDEVFEGLKAGKKITSENIPAATQLFTPHWIVRYLVENSLGRLWMLNHPDSKLIQQMDYYIKPEQPETDFLRISSPEEIKVCDPACGSGHMLVYAFDLLYSIYEEEGFDPATIPERILTNNLYGIEIDERAGELGAFSLTMKACSRQRRFFRKGIKPNICVLQNVDFTSSNAPNGEQDLFASTEQGHDEAWKAMVDFVCKSGVNREALIHDLHLFAEADNFGSLLRPQSSVGDVVRAISALNEYDQSVQSAGFTHRELADKARTALHQADYLSQKYHVVVANPPYMGGKGMNQRLNSWAKENYSDSKADLFSMFVERILMIVIEAGYTGLMTPFTWMFLTSFERLRSMIIAAHTITNLVRPEYHSFFESAYVPICGFTLFNRKAPTLAGAYVDMNQFYGADNQPVKLLEAIRNHGCGWFYTAYSSDFEKIPGTPIAYWVSDRLRRLFHQCDAINEVADVRQGLQTGDNGQFLRFWYEVGHLNIGFGADSRFDALGLRKRWFPIQKGGQYRKWYGNHDYVVDWENDGEKIRNFFDSNGKLRSRPQNLDLSFKPAITWTAITAGSFTGRLCEGGFLYNTAGPMACPKDPKILRCLAGLMNCSVTNELLKLLAPTMNYSQGPVAILPWPKNIELVKPSVDTLVARLVQIAKTDWDSLETSWDFKTFPLICRDGCESVMQKRYLELSKIFKAITLEMQRQEEENNLIFVEAFGLKDEITVEVPLHEVTLSCNPFYCYGVDKSGEELESLQLADMMREFISYAVGCMFGRYSLDVPGLVIASQGEGLQDYSLKHNSTLNWGVATGENDDPSVLLDVAIEKCSFLPDWDNVIPVLDGDWFPGDICSRFCEFLKVTFGKEHYEENLNFIEDAIGKDIRKFFVKDFYNDHLKRYKKRPIYWMFSSPKGSFNALIYMHRYRPDTVSIILNDYLREYRSKLASRLEYLGRLDESTDTSSGDKAKALKESLTLKKTIDELDTYEREILHPLAGAKLEIDLDDGVKVNYGKFGAALKTIPGLDANED